MEGKVNRHEPALQSLFEITLFSCAEAQILRIPAVCQEAAICMSRAVAAWCWAGWALCLEGLPGEGSAV